ncbi:MAG TPA: hypothetical protein VLT88_02270 [Desulfosarcina sp.]|nr:hypothetical protein [Desulfosarcina sp.]
MIEKIQALPAFHVWASDSLLPTMAVYGRVAGAFQSKTAACPVDLMDHRNARGDRGNFHLLEHLSPSRHGVLRAPRRECLKNPFGGKWSSGLTISSRQLPVDEE